MEFKITAITYNVNKQKPLQDDIICWLDFEELNDSQIVCFALQEVPHAEMLKTTSNTWCEQLTNWVKEKSFSLVNKICLASNMLLVYLKVDLLQMIDQIDERWCRSSLFGTIGYKGTISSRLLFRSGISIVFIASHFFAQEKFLRDRINQYKQSLNCTFPEIDCSKKHIIWLGDFNFRVEDFSDSQQLLYALNKLDDVDMLTNIANSHDQLIKAKRLKKVFQDFEEGIIRFKPTYRIMVGSGKFDKQRIPSWCDRILFKSNKNSNSSLLIKQYRSCRRITLSDHFPVSAKLILGINSPTNILTKAELAVWPCYFEHIPRWKQLIPLFCRLTIPTQFWTVYSSNLDWIGLYSTNIEIINKPINWVYLLTCPLDDQGRYCIEFPSLNCGMYRVGYFCTKKKCLQGLSNPFYVKEEPNY
uniref:Inositol polyphosphate-related phosphatase domain-containing protein n=2 Tax=Meloidogyne TaxID=189290 RepID=A0A6V7WIZ7_MELEN|nr:unnamed protein product [Meloidogyne enterolobii]